MVSAHIRSVLKRWCSRFEADVLLTARDIHKEDLGIVFRSIGVDLELQYLGHGSSRAAFALSVDRVLKVGFSRCGMQSNRREMLATRRLPKHLHAKVHGCAPDGLWLVQERVAVIDDWDRSYAEVDQVRTEAEQAAPNGVCDASPENFGRLPDGRLVLFDIESLVPIGAVLRDGEPVARRFAHAQEAP